MAVTDSLPRSNGKPSGRSMFGKQADARKQTFAAYSIGDSTRDTRSKAFLTSDHCKTELMCTLGPGPVYERGGAIGKQTSSRNQSLPAFSMGKDQKMKFKEHFSPGPGNYDTWSSMGKQTLNTKRSMPVSSIGKTTRERISEKQFITNGHMTQKMLTYSAPVGAYDHQSTIGKQTSSRNQSLPSYTFGASGTTRFKNKQEEFAAMQPGPGSRGTFYSMGKQTKSQFATAPKSSFGSSTRDVESRRFITNGHTKIRIGTSSEPAAEYSGRHTSSIGKQLNSMRKSKPSYGFGTQKKMHQKVEYSPGPGAYDN